MKLLHIIATPREDESNTLLVASAFLDRLAAKHGALNVDVIDLFNHDLPTVAGDVIAAKYTLMAGQPLPKRHQKSWRQIEAVIERFLAADIYLISAPMWNFGIPYPLKYYIDAIVQPGYLYKYNDRGEPVPLVLGRKMVCVTSRGGDYAEPSPFESYDFQTPYLRTIFGFVGITDIRFINAQPMDMTPILREAALARAVEEARSLVANSQWDVAEGIVGTQSPAGLRPQPGQVSN